MSELLYNHEQDVIVTHTYLINGGGPHYIEDSGTITIIFKNGKLDEVRFPFSGYYSRNQWRILASIEREISRLEAKEEGTK